MVTTTASLRERKKEATREHLLTTAIGIMSDRGFENVKVEAIAAAAGIGKGTVYNYFQTKEDIVVAFFMQLERETQRKLARWTSGHGTLEATLTSFLRYQFRLKQPDYKFVRIFFTQMFARPEQMFPYIVALQAVIDPPLIKLFEALQARSLLRADVPIAALVLQFKTLHFGLSATWALEGPPWQATAKALPMQVRLFAGGLGVQRA